MADYVQVSTATEHREQAVELARTAVRDRLAAGAQIIGPVTSVFWHAGEFGTGEEWQLLLKTTAERYPELEKHLVDRHPWKNPEVCATPITAGAEPCLQWIQSSTTAH
ncbi:divalent-cation tolerance protein CutA [Streptomyces spectabilis]|uniref:Divalent-cation tolerance protein CutA n=1 Tax=Streptomyces spectabilis TaxID=68270 RepID=A0A516RK83_STRST|nr:divalent-cation tolerance protein CutA [Streptomyces spectabilis]QDQ16044.1 divalent-cation tolerance protein CutA [Streptomyces spectabilis]